MKDSSEQLGICEAIKNRKSCRAYLNQDVSLDIIEQDQIHDRISKMYDDRYDGSVDEAFFQKKLKEYKDREFAIIQEMESHAKADESFHVTANMVLSLAQRSREIFESSEVEEKRQLLNFVFQNFELKDKKLSITLREPFKIIKDTSLLEKCPGMCR